MPPALRPLDDLPETAQGPVLVPASLDDVDALLELRDAIESRIVREQDDVVLDCSQCTVVCGPALGWLLDVGTMLARHDRALRLLNAGAELSFQLRSRSTRPGLPIGIILDASPAGIARRG